MPAIVRKLRTFVARLAAVLVSCLIGLLLLEVGIRLLLPASQWRYRDSTMDARPDARMGWVLRPNQDVTTTAEQGWSVRFRTNADGLTPVTARREKPPGTVRIMLFGDSTVLGRSVPPEATVHADLRRLLERRGHRVDVVNAGVEGYSTDQALLQIERLIPLYRPDIVAYSLCDNDFGGNAEGEAYGVVKPRFVLSAEGRLTLVPPDPGRLRAEIPTFGGGRWKWLQFSALYRVVRPRLMVLRARLGDWEHRNLIGLPSEMYSDPRRMEAVDWRLFSALLVRMKEVSERSGARFFFYSHPAIAEVWEPYIRDIEARAHLRPGQYDRFALQKRLQAVASATGVLYCPLIESFLAQQERGPFHLLPRDPHCNPAGYEVTAETLAACLESSGVLLTENRAQKRNPGSS